MTKKIITLCGLIFILMLTVKITTKNDPFTQRLLAQNYTSETNTIPLNQCALCLCTFNANGDCCCGGVTVFGSLPCFCNRCLGSFT